MNTLNFGSNSYPQFCPFMLANVKGLYYTFGKGRIKNNKNKKYMKSKKGTILHELRQKIKQQERGEINNLECAKCGNKKNLTADHIIPQSFLEQLGLFDERYNMVENFQILCVFCNHDKRNQIDIRNPQTIKLLKQVIKTAEQGLLKNNQ